MSTNRRVPRYRRGREATVVFTEGVAAAILHECLESPLGSSAFVDSSPGMSPSIELGDDPENAGSMPELDPEAEALLDDLADGITPAASAVSIETGRQLLEQLFAVDDPEPVASVTDLDIPGPSNDIPLRLFVPDTSPSRPVLVYFHGGGWVRGSIDAYDGPCRILANETGCLVVSVDYRLAPEHPFPAAPEDCYTAAQWAVDNAADIGGDPDRVAIAGDSAGGNLTAAVTLMARDRGSPNIAHQSLIYPAVNPPALRWFDSYDENAEGFLLETTSVEWYYEQYVRAADWRNAYAFPLIASDASDLPPATILTAGFDPLRDEGQAYADRLERAGVPVERLHYGQQIHAFLSLYEYISTGRDALDAVAVEITSALE